jgi:hypothetical protein
MTLSILVSLFASLITPVDTSIHTTVEAQAIISDAGVTPFWMRSLQYGSVPMENPGLILRAWNGKGYNLKKKYDWKYEVEATGWTGMQNDIWLTQAYVSARRGKWELWAGRRKEVYGLGDTTMTGGFYTWSGNAVPMPKVQLGTRDYLNFAKGWLGVHLTYSHGWFDNQGQIENAFLHQKSLYGRLGKPNSKIQIFGGLNHQVQWAGNRKIAEGLGFDVFPSSLNAYFYVITLLKDRTVVKIDENTSWDDANNQYGNHLGSIDLAFKIQGKLGTVLIYKQTAYETGRIFKLITADDGISGISLKLKRKAFIQGLTFEYLYTANQGRYISGLATFLGITKDPHKRERENYFNNGARGEGWQYFGKGIGTPMIIINTESKINGILSFNLNAVQSFYFGIYGNLQNFNWQLRISQSYHTVPLDEWAPIPNLSFYTKQFSTGFQLERNYSKKLILTSFIGMDSGQRIKDTFGARLGIRYILF